MGSRISAVFGHGCVVFRRGMVFEFALALAAGDLCAGGAGGIHQRTAGRQSLVSAGRAGIDAGGGGLVYPDSGHQRPGLAAVARNPYAVFEPGGKTVVIHNIRDFDYRTEKDFTVRYLTETYDLDKLKTMDYIQVHWDGLKVIAHSMLSFGFEDGRHLVVSVETRLAKGDVQGGLPGLYKQFGLLMILGTERDLLGLRTNYRHEKVYLYPTRCSREEVRTVFLDILRRVNDLKEHPRFYNTVLHNCFTSLLPSLKLIRPQMRFDISMLFNGLTDYKAFEYQLSQGNVQGTFEDFRRAHYVNPKIDHVAELPANYSEVIRRADAKK